jgi:uncharacterized tellurite resistance protein B-like protein
MKEALSRLMQALRSPVGEPTPEEREHDLRLATAALLFEVVRADGDVRDEERAVMRAAVHSAFALPAAELDALITRSEHASVASASLYDFTRLVDKDLDAEEKRRVVELLWVVAFADGSKDALEEHIIRRISDLLHVPHPEFIDAKLKAKAAKV